MQRNYAILTLIFINILWGTSYGISKVALEEIPPPVVGALRWGIATLILWLIHFFLTQQNRWQGKTDRPKVAATDRTRLFALGSLGIGIAYVIDYFGINLTTATDASLMIIGEVIFTSLLAFWLTNDPLGRWKVLGMVLGAAGVTILVLGHVSDTTGSDHGWWRAVGDLLILVTLALQALYTVLGSDLARKYPPMTVLTYVCTGSLFVWIPILLWYQFNGWMPESLSVRAIGAVLYLSIVTSVFCNFVWFRIASRIGAGISAISLFAQPLVGSLIGLFLLNEPLTLSLMVGAIFIFAALYLTTLARSSRG